MSLACSRSNRLYLSKGAPVTAAVARLVILLCAAAAATAAAQSSSVPDVLARLPPASGRAAILVDGSAAAADATAATWDGAVAVAEWLIARLPADAEYQVIVFADQARALRAPSGAWFVRGSEADTDELLRALHANVPPVGQPNLAAAFSAAAALVPKVERIYLVAAAAPGRELPEARRSSLFANALKSLPKATPVDTLLLPSVNGDEVARFWFASLRTRGSVLALPNDRRGSASAESDPRFEATHAVFVVDTSGSMVQLAWERVQRVVREVITRSASLEDFLIVNDEGRALEAAPTWTAVSPDAVEKVAGALAHWQAHSGSAPTGGILRAVELARGVGPTTIYVLGDDLAVSAPEARRVERSLLDVLNRDEVRGNIVVSTIVFPTIYEATGELYTAAGFATLQHELAVRTGGFFVGLPAR